MKDDLNAALKDAIGEHEFALVAGVPALRRQIVTGRKFDETSFRDDHPDLADKYMVDTVQIRLSVVK